MSALSLGLFNIDSYKEKNLKFTLCSATPKYYLFNKINSINGQGIGILFRSVKFSVPLSILIYK